MKQIKYLIFITLFISSFFFINNVHADYDAIVLNPSGASCDLKDNSTGYCIYSDESLDNYVSGVVWLNTGSEVKVITDIQSVPTKDADLCSDYYVAIDYYYASKNKTYRGYYCNANLITSEISEEEKQQFTELGFPESYFKKLRILKLAHPNWEFKPVNTKLDFNEAVKALNIAGRSLVQRSSSNNYAYLDINSSSFDYYNNKYIPYDSKSSDNAWYNANSDTIAYYLDPRNFLSDMYIFQFESLAYENSLTDEELNNTISVIFKDDYLNKYVIDFITAGKESKVSPVYLASLSKQEVGGSSTPNSAISGNIEGYEGIYNFYNIGASSGDNPVLNGLSFAKGTDETVQRPWNTEYKAIVGGALWIKNRYIGFGQNTSYFKKWNVIYNYLVEKGEITNPYANFTHQYMTNIMAPTSESKTTYKSYHATGILESKFTFYIPVYENMPEKTTLPTKTGWPNNYLSELIINDKQVPEFDGEITLYNYYLDINVDKIKIDAIPVSSKASIEGIGEFEIPDLNLEEENIISYTIKVTAENKDVKEYKLNIILTGEKVEDPIDVVTTLNNSGIKNGDKYLSGFELGTDISIIKDKILHANEYAKVELKNSSGEEKLTGALATGDKVIITVNEETKEYEVVIYGDANGDGAIDAIDFIRLKKYMLNQVNMVGVYAEAIDINKDGAIDAIDFIRLKKYMLGNMESIIQ